MTNRTRFPGSAYLFALLTALCLSGCHACQAQQPAATTQDGYTYKKPSSGGTGKVYMGREIAAIMTATGGNWLDRDTRQEEENSPRTIENMNLQPASVVADIGAGTGFYTFQLAPKVPDGKVYAVEVQDRFIKTLESRRDKEGATHVSVVKSDSLRVNLPAQAIDIALMVDVYHELTFPKEILRSIHQALKPNGKLLLLEYKAEDPDIRIKELHKMTAEQIKKELEANGFRLQRQEDFLPIQHFMLFEKVEETGG
ncbi:class I SAM-dependent methyltransferase [Pontibacter sp. HSC-14F20]|uniref:class I SAM-dependent methyltransferase n=1 Tax=Pontibacter sp. HSC-14F20 TaxID=2864136 RepID=UPI001C736FBE|nr:class I SAM-dependent methyltransferase [Pontibacter sp. HSC-14F20]MBX0333386.1 class I SAM-dependent methyltransferase [Pontibacter sp. HSC-14F20]